MISFRATTDQFSALGTTIEGGIRADQKQAVNLWRQVRHRVQQFERRFSRFRPDSELSRLNLSPGAAFSASPEMMAILETARRMWVETEGLVDPAVGRMVQAAGYDVSFEKTGAQITAPTVAVTTRRTFADVQIDTTQRTVTLPVGMALDFGGIGKGFLLDQLRPTIEQVTTDYWISLGGDLMVSGTNEQGQVWAIGVQDPRTFDRDIAWLTPPPGRWAVATSGTQKRRGVRGGIPWHHLIDPMTGQPSTSDVIAAAALTRTGWEAEVVAKTVLLKGVSAGIAWATDRPYTEALAIDAHGQLHRTSGMAKMLSAS